MIVTQVCCLWRLGPEAGATQVASRPTSRPTTRPAHLVSNGDFETPAESGKLPADWTTKHPTNVRVIEEGAGRGRVIEMTGGKKLMASYGVDLTSGKIPLKANTHYRCTGHTRSDGPNMKVFVKGYATVTRSVNGQVKTFEDAVYQMRKDIEPTDDWELFNLDFDLIPARLFSDHQHRIEHLRITLWAYWPAGTCWFDDIRFEEVGPAADHEKRHAEPVTHVGVPPRLGPAAKRAATAKDEKLDEQQTWRDAVNALRTQDHQRAARLAERLIKHAPHSGSYRVLAARAAAGLQRWDAAEQHARWLLRDTAKSKPNEAPSPQVEPWQRDWARVVLAQVYQHTERQAQARDLLKQLLSTKVSPHARAAAAALLKEIEDADK